MQRRLPTISIVTICRNADKTIERTIRSVLACPYPYLEYVIIDGGSTDGTLAVVERYRGHIAHFVSEPDQGISDAMNKGIKLTSGEYHYLLHADDELNGNALRSLADKAVCCAPVIVGNVRVMAGDRMVRLFRPQPTLLKEKMSIPHMGCLVRKDVWAEIGGYDLRRKIAMDHLFMLKVRQRYGDRAFEVVDAIVADYHLGGVSDRRVLEGFKELRRNLRECGVGAFGAAAVYCKLVMKSYVGRWIRGS